MATPSAPAAPPPDTPALGYAPDRAIRARLNAIVIDGLLLGVASRILLPALGAHSAASAGLGLLVLQFLYFFCQEATRGQTIGKRQAGLRVIGLDGGAPTIKQLALRNALRVFDALPMFYASGLVSVMWTGPGRRQRLGDRVASTAVILQPGRKLMKTPGWLLPTLTVLAVLLSVVFYGAVYDAYRSPNVDANALLPASVPGFSGDNAQPPSSGRFVASANVNGVPLVDHQTGKPAMRAWEISKSCSGSACSYEITRDVPGFGEESGRLVPEADGWHADFPTKAFRVACGGGLTTVLERASFVVHFDPGGGSAEAHEVNLFRSDSCGSFTRSLDWSATQAHL